MMTLQPDIERHFACEAALLDHPKALATFTAFKAMLNRGEVRAAEKSGSAWKVNDWVKKGILLGFRLGELVELSLNDQFRFFDKSTFPLKSLTLNDAVREVPGGSAIRDGAYVAPGVVCMPPMYINVGAYVDEHTMIDSHALVGSCAQIGKRVHLSAASQIGGVLEPVGALPVIVEDDVFIGGNCGVYEGTVVSARAVLAAGVILTGSTAVYDVVHNRILKKESGRPLTIPEGAVVIPGSRPLADPWALRQQLHITSPVIIKYRDAKTDAATALEDSLR